MSPRLLEGEVLTEGEDAALTALHERVKGLVESNRQLAEENTQLTIENEKMGRAMKVLKRQLTPFYTALQMLFGELEVVADRDPSASPGETPAAAGGLSDRHKQVLDNWKSKLGMGPSKIIDALVLHGAMNYSQLGVACGYDRSTVPQYVAKLKGVGLVRKVGDNKWELKLP